MVIFIAIVLALAVLVFISYPFFQQPDKDDSSGDEKFRELHSRRNTTYSMLKELEFDYQSGLLTEDDYHDLESRYKRKAISILKDADTLENGNSLETEIEAQVQKVRGAKSDSIETDLEEQVMRLRRDKSNDVNKEIEKEITALRRGRGQSRFCAECGTKAEEGDVFCSNCGKQLK